MNRFKNYKLIQVIIFVMIACVSVFFLLSEPIKQSVFSTAPATVLFFMIWSLMILCFVFILIDFFLLSKIKIGDKALYGVAYSDQVSGIPNRFSCDSVIEKYADANLPDDLGCAMIEFSNLAEINKTHGHKIGNHMIKEFSQILQSTAAANCFVGRNGGNKFLAVFEESSSRELVDYSKRVALRIKEHNSAPNAITLEYKIGASYNGIDKLDEITKMITLANQRINAGR